MAVWGRETEFRIVYRLEDVPAPFDIFKLNVAMTFLSSGTFKVIDWATWSLLYEFIRWRYCCWTKAGSDFLSDGSLRLMEDVICYFLSVAFLLLLYVCRTGLYADGVLLLFRKYWL